MSSAMKSFFDPKQVSYLIFYVTNRCNFKCDFCFYHNEIGKGRKADELTLEEIARFTRTVGPLIQLSLTGGEPFLREDLSEITSEFVRNTGARYITIPTNASLPDRIADYINNTLPKHPNSYFRITFSIDAIGTKHDENRSAPGAWDKIIQSYAEVSPLREKFSNLVLDANAIFTQKTEDAILDTLKALNKDFKFDNLSVTYARGNIRDPKLKEVSFNKYIAMNDYLQGIERSREKRPLYFVWRGVRDLSREYLIRTVEHGEFITPCVAGRKLLVVSETGEVYPCEILDKKMGNIRDFDLDLRKILSRKENKDLLDWVKDSKCKCPFECALAANVLWGRRSYLKLLKASLRNI